MKFILLLVLTFISFISMAESFYYNVGGGYAPYSSEAVLELNMKLINELIWQESESCAETVNLFAAGPKKRVNDVIEASRNLNEEQKIIYDILKSSICPDCCMRANQLSDLDGSSSLKSVTAQFSKLSEKIGPFDRFRFYYTGHGGAGEDNDFSKSYLALWNKTPMNIELFLAHLDKINHKAHTQVLMVQCFSGGFARMIYERGNPENGFSKANRCGFFSQIESRAAAGCTPDLKIREEYSPYFFSAYRGKDEKGRSVDSDFNHDGVITSSEAHAFVALNENSIDIPITTSSYLLDRHVDIDEDLFYQSWGEILDLSTPEEKALLEGLAKILGLSHLNIKPYLEIFNLYAVLQNEQDKMIPEYNQVYDEYKKVKEVISSSLIIKSKKLKKFYESRDFKNKKRALELSISEESKYADDIESHLQFSDYTELKMKSEKFEDRYDLISHRIVKVERLIMAINTVLARAKMMKSDNHELIQKYQDLYQCENQSYF